MRIDPEIATELEADAGLSPLRELPLAEYRDVSERMMLSTLGPPESVERVEEVVVVGSSKIHGTLYRPAKAGEHAPAILFIHGGGWVIGSRLSYDPLCRALANRSGAVILAIDYRRAPEYRHPSAVEDSVAAARWLIEHAGKLGLDPLRIGVGGDSAGGNLAAVVARQARDEGWGLACQLLIYPVMSTHRDKPSYKEFANGYGLTAADVAWFWDQYLGKTVRGVDPSASPLLLSDLRGLPSAIVISAECDILRDDAEAYADRLVEAGVPTVRLRALGMPHAFLNYFGRSMAARRVYTVIAALLADTLAAPEPVVLAAADTRVE